MNFSSIFGNAASIGLFPDQVRRLSFYELNAVMDGVRRSNALAASDHSKDGFRPSSAPPPEMMALLKKGDADG